MGTGCEADSAGAWKPPWYALDGSHCSRRRHPRHARRRFARLLAVARVHPDGDSRGGVAVRAGPRRDARLHRRGLSERVPLDARTDRRAPEQQREEAARLVRSPSLARPLTQFVSGVSYFEISSTTSPVRWSLACCATSAWATTPTSRPSSSTTGSRRTWFCAIRRSASSRSCCGS